MVVRVKMTMNNREVSHNLKRLDESSKAAIRAIVDRRTAIGVGYMKVNAPWSDETGAARSGLNGTAHHEETKHTIVFAHAVHYGIWLEVKNSGRYEIIMPTVREQARQLGNDLDRLWAKI